MPLGWQWECRVFPTNHGNLKIGLYFLESSPLGKWWREHRMSWAQRPTEPCSGEDRASCLALAAGRAVHRDFLHITTSPVKNSANMEWDSLLRFSITPDLPLLSFFLSYTFSILLIKDLSLAYILTPWHFSLKSHVHNNSDVSVFVCRCLTPVYLPPPPSGDSPVIWRGESVISQKGRGEACVSISAGPAQGDLSVKQSWAVLTPKYCRRPNQSTLV